MGSWGPSPGQPCVWEAPSPVALPAVRCCLGLEPLSLGPVSACWELLAVVLLPNPNNQPPVSFLVLLGCPSDLRGCSAEGGTLRGLAGSQALTLSVGPTCFPGLCWCHARGL